MSTAEFLAAREKKIKSELYRNRDLAEHLKRALILRPDDPMLNEKRRRQQDRKTELLASLGRLDLPPVIVLRDVIDSLVKIEDADAFEQPRLLSEYIDSLEKKEAVAA